MISFISFFALIISVNSYAHLDKLCTDITNRDACNNIGRDQTYECAENIVSKTDCFLNIDKGQHQFAVVEPEQALLAAKFVSENVIVIGEVSENPPYQTVVVVRNFYNNSFEDLRGKRFCHPGFKHDELITRYVLQEFESKIIQLNHTYCQTNPNGTLLEKQISVLSNFFGSSCRPGPWTNDDDILDANLKTKYSNLCELCGSEKCAVNYLVPFNDALTCLSRDGGDVAITSLKDALAFFNNPNNNGNFKFLCSDGSTRDPSVANCTWTNQINRLIITEKTVANDPKAYLERHLPNHISAFATQALTSNLPLTDSLESLLELSKSDRISFFDAVPLNNYVSVHRTIPTIVNNTYCDEVVNWCTLTEAEQQKCLWLQQAALNTGLQPVIQCINSTDNDTVSCLIDLETGKADVTFVDVAYGYIALKKGLTSVAYPETYNKDLTTVVIAVRNDSTVITSLKDLKEKRACFPQYGGQEWLAFIDIMISKKIMDDKCEYGQLFSDFVGPSCVPGSREQDYGFITGDSEKLCSQCIPTVNSVPAKYCNADEINKYYGTDGALKCIENNEGDYAVITLKDIKEYKDKSNAFKVLCKNGSLASYNGLTVDTGAALTVITSGEIVVKDSTEKRENIIQLLKGIELEFGQSLKKIFKVFEKFNDIPDLLFPDSTPGLTFDGNEIGLYVENFKTLLRNSEKCVNNDSSTANSFIPSLIIMILLMVIARF